MDETMLDGNAAAGMLAEIFTAEMTVAVTCCAICGSRHHVGELHAYLQAPGVVLRCRSCGTAQIRMVRATGRAWLNFSGIRSLQLELPSDVSTDSQSP